MLKPCGADVKMTAINGTLTRFRHCFSVASIIIGGVATGLPDAYAKIAFAVALGLSNAAIYIKSEQSNGENNNAESS